MGKKNLLYIDDTLKEQKDVLTFIFWDLVKKQTTDSAKTLEYRLIIAYRFFEICSSLAAIIE